MLPDEVRTAINFTDIWGSNTLETLESCEFWNFRDCGDPSQDRRTRLAS